MHPLLWVLALIFLVAPVLIAMSSGGESRIPSERFGFLQGATLAGSFPPQYSTSLRVKKGNAYVYELPVSRKEIVALLGMDQDWQAQGTTRRGSMVLRHKDGTRIYLSDNPTDGSKTRIYIVDSVRSVGWVERRVVRALSTMPLQ